MDFIGFPKLSRLVRECVVTEKIDGTNAQVCITPEGDMFVGSRTRWITPEDDNAGFARWCSENKDELLKLGVGSHFGEWWGKGIQRTYGLRERRFSLFNVSRWSEDNTPSCCSVVPILYNGIFNTTNINRCLTDLRDSGSVASEGFMRPEGICVYHVAANKIFKQTLEGDGHKGIKIDQRGTKVT